LAEREFLEALTPGGGRHLYFKNVSGLKGSASRVGNGLDIRDNGLDTDEIEQTLESAFNAAEPRYDGLKKTKKKGATNTKPDFSVDDFRTYMPDHRYVFIPTRDMWQSSSVDSRVAWPADSDG
jgi:hypothetical protein